MMKGMMKALPLISSQGFPAGVLQTEAEHLFGFWKSAAQFYAKYNTWQTCCFPDSEVGPEV